MDHHHYLEAASRHSPSDDHFDPAPNSHAATVNEVEYIVGAHYFTLDSQAQVYAFNPLYEAIFSVSSTCRPLSPIMPIPPGSSITLQNTFVRATSNGWLECLRPGSPQWEPVELFQIYADARPTTTSLVNSIQGIDLGLYEDVEAQFYSYGNPPTWESIDKWVEYRKAIRAPSICPLNDCKHSLRRPHALKDHLFFKFNIKAFECNNTECDRSFATKTNCDRHTKDCKAGGSRGIGY